jgi:DedD protein
MKIFHCEIKRFKVITPQLCAICPRIERCRAFRMYYRHCSDEYITFVTKIVEKFPDKYQMEVLFMAEKQTFVQIVDQKTGMVERVADMKEIEALSTEDKLALARTKTLYVVSHRLEPVIKVEMRKVSINPVAYKQEEKVQPKPEVKPQPKPQAKPQTKPAKVEKQAEIPMKTTPKGKKKK